MKIKISYQNRYGKFGDLPTVSRIILANRFLKQSGFLVSDKASVEYSPNTIIIRKLNSNL